MRFKTIIAATGLLAAVAAFCASPAIAQDKKGTDVSPVCAECHDTNTYGLAYTAHGAKNDANGSACQTCHGDATAHLKDQDKATPQSALLQKDATAAAKSAVCLACHAGSRHLENWNVAKHRKVNVTCINCHSIHQKGSAANNAQIKGAQFAAAPYTTTVRQLTYMRCVECHADVRADILKPSHHPIIEGKVGCQDCHDPHGGLQKASLRNESVSDLCLSCHADKRGPWIHEHPPVEENCAICHTPHGSAHKGLLAQKPPALCADCHANGHTHGIYDGRGTIPGTLPSNIRFQASGCVNCHRQIHGSNAPSSAYGEYFLR